MYFWAMKQLLLVLCMLVSLLAQAQTDYVDDVRAEELTQLYEEARLLNNRCNAYVMDDALRQVTYDSLRDAYAALDIKLKALDYSSRYRPVLGLCYATCLGRVAAMYMKHEDTGAAYIQQLKLIQWLEETYNSEMYPIKLKVIGESEYYEFNRDFLANKLRIALGPAINVALTKEDWETVKRGVVLFLDPILSVETDNKKMAHLLYYQALEALEAPTDEKLEWLVKTVRFYKSVDPYNKNWRVEAFDISMTFYELLADMNASNQSVELNIERLCASLLRDMYNKKEVHTIYTRILTQRGLLDFDTDYEIYDYYYSLGEKADAKFALSRINVEYLGCVDLSVVARCYRDLGEEELAKEFEKRYKKCMRESKQMDRWSKRQEFADAFDWIPDFWDEKMNIALSVNPIAGLNTKAGRVGGPFKFIPMSADMRMGAFVHEFRWNRFIDYNGSDRFTRGNLGKATIENEIFNQWKSLKGNDYSYFLGVVAHRTEDEDYDARWKGYHAFGPQYLWGSFTAGEEVASVLLKGNTTPQDIRIRPSITRSEWLFMWKYSRFYKGIFYYTLFTAVGAGQRSLAYNSPDAGIGEGQLLSATESTFYDQRLVQSNWTGRKLTMRAGFRIGITLK